MGCGSSTNKNDIIQPMTSTPVKQVKPVSVDQSLGKPISSPQAVATPNTEAAEPIKPPSEAPKAVKVEKESQNSPAEPTPSESKKQSSSIIGEDDKLVEDSWKDCENNLQEYIDKFVLRIVASNSRSRGIFTVDEESRVEESSKAKATELFAAVGRSIAGLQDCEKCVEILKEYKFGVKPEQFLEIADIVSAVVCENGNDSLKSAWRISVYKTVQKLEDRLRQEYEGLSRDPSAVEPEWNQKPVRLPLRKIRCLAPPC
uniref:Uncharacterized protein n=1 Tax=Guillardia theta TaxID=55529 RepID=A0A7S4P8U3_GUITH|mmetsp:Transcript_45574/g.143127  ORF Transcript_45574/g.143127 Transcript_45574/m.143127 type:complete len:258 (+) Transcript_45574:31-804(+)